MFLHFSFWSRPTGTVFQHQPHKVFCDYDFVQPRDMRVEELAMMVDLARQVGIILLGRLEHHLRVSRSVEYPFMFQLVFLPLSHW